MLITFSGIDNAGKTTQIELLAARLKREGGLVRTRWFRPGYTARLDALRSLVRRLRPAALPAAHDVEARSRAFGRPGVRRAWQGIALLDTLVELAVVLRAQELTGATVLCDRYLDDARLDLSLRFPETDLTSVWRSLSALCPAPDLAVLLMLPWDEMERRAARKNEPFPDPEAVRRRRYDAYVQLARDGRYEVIDASGDLSEVHERIWSAVVAHRGRP